MTEMSDLWVFGYGSLMWRPGFDYLAAERAVLLGYRRSLCVRSYVHRGTPQRPGLVLGLDRGGSCVGVAFRIARDRWSPIIEYLRERELVTNVYLERRVRIRLSSGEQASAITYVVDRRHIQYAGRLSPQDAAQIIVGGVGQSGSNEDYVLSTLDHMRTLRIRDTWTETVASLITLPTLGSPGDATAASPTKLRD